MTQFANTLVAETIVFDLPPEVDGAGAAELIADMVKLPQGNEISLNAAAISAVSLGYLQILASAFKTFPKLTVSGASAEFAEVFDGYGIAFPFGEAPALMAQVDAAPLVETEIVQAHTAPAEAEATLVAEIAPDLAPGIEAAPAA